MMNDLALTKDERLCLQGWFRQALVQIERQEVTAHILQEFAPESEDGHRAPVVRRRSRRTPVFSHMKQLVR